MFSVTSTCVLQMSTDVKQCDQVVRTPWQQAWARSIELLDARLNLSLKDGLGPEALLSYVVPIAYALEVTYRGDRLNPATDAELEALRTEAERWMRERGKDT